MEALALTALASPSIAASQDAAAIPPISEEVADYSAMLKRAEYCIECLRTRYICDGCKVHEEGAERVLRYFRSQAAGEPDNAEEWQAIIDFFCSHGQSLDWILSGDPCGLINDPIFAAIEDHKRACRGYRRWARKTSRRFGPSASRLDGAKPPACAARRGGQVPAIPPATPPTFPGLLRGGPSGSTMHLHPALPLTPQGYRKLLPLE
jgi:hypothetical protein